MPVSVRFFAFIILVAYSVKIFDCAKDSGKFGRIVRGRDAVIGQFPYVVRLDVDTKDGEFLCGAALIGLHWLLTAAHCVYDIISLKASLGSISINRANISYNVAISDITIHPKFSWCDMINDIALIRIPQTILLAKTALIPLPKMRCVHHKYENAYATACGWGLTATNGSLSKVLQYGRFKILSKKKCKRLGMSKTEMCAATRSDLAATCDGDSGGPLVLEKTGELVGITSHGDDNCDDGILQIFTRVTSYLGWIKSVSGIFHR